MGTGRFSLILSIIVCIFASCAPRGEGPSPSDFPWTFVRSDSIALSRTYIDLNGDGTKESVETMQQHGGEKRCAIFINAPDGSLIDQINFFGATSVSPWFAYDFHGDGGKDLWCTVARGETLTAEIVDPLHARHSTPLFTIPLYVPEGPQVGAPRDVSARLWGVIRSSSGKGSFLIASITTGYARRPRAIEAFEIPSGRLMWRHDWGASIGSVAIDETSPDSVPRIFVGTNAPDNGASAGGFDDAHSYIAALTLAGKIAWSREMGGRFSSTSVCVGDNDGDGRFELSLWYYAGSRGGRASFFTILRPETGTQLARNDFRVPMVTCTEFTLLGGNTRSHGYAACSQEGEITLLDGSLKPRRTIRTGMPAAAFRIADVRGEGDDEITVFFESGAVEVFSSELAPVAWFPPGGGYESFAAVSFPSRGTPDAGKVVFSGGPGSIIGRFEANPPRSERLLMFFGVGALLIIAGAASSYGLYRGWLFIRSYKMLSERIERIGLMVIGRRGTIRSMNEPLRSFMGIPAGTWKGTLWQTVFAGPQYAELAAYLAGSGATHRGTRIALSLDFRDLDLVVRAFPLAIGPVRFGMLIVISDISDFLRADRMLNWALVAQNLAHEMKTPLSTIWFTLERMRQAKRSVPPGPVSAAAADAGEEEHFQSIEEEIKRLDRYVKGLMKLANLSAPALQRTSVNDLLCSHLDLYCRKLPASVQIERDFGADLPPIDVDVNLFTAALDNILDNAVTAMRGEGTLKVETYVAQDLKESWVCCAVADTGCGIPEVDVPKVFQPYFTRSQGGTGLGLVITKRIVEDHGGKITFTSQVGLGSQFVTYWPPATGNGDGLHG